MGSGAGNHLTVSHFHTFTLTLPTQLRSLGTLPLKSPVPPLPNVSGTMIHSHPLITMTITLAVGDQLVAGYPPIAAAWTPLETRCRTGQGECIRRNSSLLVGELTREAGKTWSALGVWEGTSGNAGIGGGSGAWVDGGGGGGGGDRRYLPNLIMEQRGD